MRLDGLRSSDFNRHLFTGDRPPDTSQILSVRRNGFTQPFAARYVLATVKTLVPVAPVINCFVPIVNMAARRSYHVVYDGRDMFRQPTGIGSFVIRDRRISQYTDLLTVNNVSFYLPVPDLEYFAYQAHAPKFERLPSLLDEYMYDTIMFHIAKTVEEVLRRPAEASPLFVSHLYDAVCIHICEMYGGLKSQQGTHRGGLSPRHEAQVKNLLLSDLRGDVGLQDLAASCGMSERHFARAFKKSTGVPPHRWLLIKRIERAQSMLQQSVSPISAIAFDCGFADQSHLTRVFSKSVGMSPAMWRRIRQH